MDLTGETDGAPQKPGVAYSDLFTGLYSVVAIQSALLARSINGIGTHIDMSLFDTQLEAVGTSNVNSCKGQIMIDSFQKISFKSECLNVKFTKVHITAGKT